MFIIHSSYITEPTQIEPYRKAHADWVVKYINEGIFLFAGPKKSKLGGVILAKNIDKQRLLEILSEDSYVKADIVENQVIDFSAVFAVPELTSLTKY